MKLYLSICIPTNGRISIIKNTLDSIFLNSKIPYTEFEVVLSDNSSNDELKELLELYNKYPNIRYFKSNCEGFLNSINSLKLGNGEFLKLHNNYTMFVQDGLEELLNFIKGEIHQKPAVFFKNTGENDLIKFESFDLFCQDLSYWNTWSTGFSIWKSDLLKFSNNHFDKMFPHVTLLNLLCNKKSFVINENQYFINQDVKGKGGYNLFKTFAVDYLLLMENSMNNNEISASTYNKIKHDLFNNFLVTWYFNTKIRKNDFTFDLSDIKKNISVNFGKIGYLKLVFLAYFLILKKIYLKIKRSLTVIQNKLS